MPDSSSTVDLTFGGPGKPPQPWQVHGPAISFDGSVLVPLAVPGGNMGAGTINTGGLYVNGIPFVNPVGAYLPLTGGTMIGLLQITNPSYFSLGGGTLGECLVTDGAGNTSWSASPPGGPYLQLTGGALSGALQITGPSNLIMGGGTPGQLLTTNGAGVLAWTTPTASVIVNINDTAPGTPSSGTLWWDSVGAQLYIYYSDADSSQWVIANSLIGSYLPLGGGTLTGPLILAADPIVALGAVTKEYADTKLPLTGGTLTGGLALVAPALGDNSSNVPSTNWVAQEGPSLGNGFINRFRNGTFLVWQRGSPVTVASGSALYTADGWIVAPTGATCSVTSGGSVGLSWGSLVLNCAAGITGCNIQQRIESYDAAILAGRRITVQFRIYNGTANPVTPQLLTYYSNAQDNWGGGFTSDLAATNLQTIPANGGNAVVSYTFNASPSARNSYSIVLLFGGSLNAASGYIAIADADVRVTGGWPVGLCANPPLPELRSVNVEQLQCYRFYFVGNNYTGGNFFGGSVTSGSPYYATRNFPVTMRAAPTGTFSSAQGSSFPASIGTVNAITAMGIQEARTASATAPIAWYSSNITATAEL